MNNLDKFLNLKCIIIIYFCRLRPMLEPEFVASEVVGAIATNENFVILPRVLRFLLPLKL